MIFRERVRVAAGCDSRRYKNAPRYDSREKAAGQRGVGDAADGQDVGGGAGMRAILAHGGVHVGERAAHDEIELGD